MEGQEESKQMPTDQEYEKLIKHRDELLEFATVSLQELCQNEQPVMVQTHVCNSNLKSTVILKHPKTKQGVEVKC